MPKFVEWEEEKFFLEFEKTAKLRGCDGDEWALLVQSKFDGKVRRTYASLNEKEASDYKVIKKPVFGSSRKGFTGVENAQVLLISRWLETSVLNKNGGRRPRMSLLLR